MHDSLFVYLRFVWATPKHVSLGISMTCCYSCQYSKMWHCVSVYQSWSTHNIARQLT